jgi:hypothetical protein
MAVSMLAADAATARFCTVEDADIFVFFAISVFAEGIGHLIE